MKENKSHSRFFKIPLSLLLCMMMLLSSVGINAASTPDASSVIFVDIDGNDANTGLNDDTGDLGNGPKRTIKSALNAVPVNGIVYIGPGRYCETEINITKNVTIIGEYQPPTNTGRIPWNNI